MDMVKKIFYAIAQCRFSFLPGTQYPVTVAVTVITYFTHLLSTLLNKHVLSTDTLISTSNTQYNIDSRRKAQGASFRGQVLYPVLYTVVVFIWYSSSTITYECIKTTKTSYKS